jgi:Ycf4
MTTQPTMTEANRLLRQEVLGSRRFSNFLWAIVSAIGGIGFLLAGISSYLKINLLIVSDTTELQFIPQGIALTLYGVAGTLLSLYLWFVILWDVGGGYNEFNKETKLVQILRKGFPGKNRLVRVDIPLADIQSVRAEIKEGLNPRRVLYLKTKKRRDLPLTRVGEPISLSQIENQGAELARFLEVPLEGL